MSDDAKLTPFNPQMPKPPFSLPERPSTAPDALKTLAALPEHFVGYNKAWFAESVLAFKQLDPLKEALAQIEQTRDQFKQFTNVCESVARSLRDLPDRTRTAVRTLAKNGWYIDPESDFIEITNATDLFDKGESEEAHQYLCDYFDGRLDGIEAVLSNRFPHRARILGQAFGAHRREEHGLSIPVFLAQADGICQELVGVQLFAREDGKPKVGAVLDPAAADSLESAYRAGLVEVFPILARPAERVGLVDFLNRHTVLHGESVDYDTRLNSCRAVSLLGYAAWILDKTPTSVV